MAWIWGFVGLLVGSLLNVLISRLPMTRGGQVAAPLHCHTCGRQLSIGDALPLLGFLSQRGRCRYCGKPISLRFPLVEITTAILFFLAFQRFGPSLPAVIASLYLAVLVLVFVIDMRHRLILNVVTYPTAIVALALSPLMPGLSVPLSLLGAAVYGGMFAVLYVLATLIYRRMDALGLGDVKLAVVIGLMTGFPMAIVAMAIGILLGGAFAIFALLRGRSSGDVMPYGTALSIGAMLTILYGPNIVRWYF